MVRGSLRYNYDGSEGGLNRSTSVDAVRLHLHGLLTGLTYVNAVRDVVKSYQPGGCCGPSKETAQGAVRGGVDGNTGPIQQTLPHPAQEPAYDPHDAGGGASSGRSGGATA